LILPVAHGLVGRQDLPIPEWLFAWGASLVLIVSFVALSLAWRQPRFETDTWRAGPEPLSRLLVNPATEVLAGALGVLLLAVVVWSGLEGTEAPDRNFALTFVFVTFWLGVVLASVLFGDVFRAFNPWRAIARSATAGFRLLAGRLPATPLRYPERIGRWPAVAGILGFVWLELVYGQSGFAAAGLAPRTVAIATLVYTGYTLTGMALFGIEKWLERGEAFSVYFGMFSRLAAIEARGGRLGWRRPLAATTTWVTVPGSVALVLVAIGGTAFDGAQEGALQQPIVDGFEGLRSAGVSPVTALRLSGTAFMAAVVAGVAAIYWAGIWGMRSAGARLEVGRLGSAFAHSFIPIALAYLVAHYFSLALFQEQAQFTYLLSDPLGDGSDLFGTAGGGIDYGLIGATGIWYVQVGALVVGHVSALVLAHDRAVSLFGEAKLAARSQYWMLALMVGFTSLGLYLLSQANA
jgi:hypothetical protein